MVGVDILQHGWPQVHAPVARFIGVILGSNSYLLPYLAVYLSNLNLVAGVAIESLFKITSQA